MSNKKWQNNNNNTMKSIYDFFPSKKTQNISASDFYKQNLPQKPVKQNSPNDCVTVQQVACTCKPTDANFLAENGKLKSELNEAHSKIRGLTIENKKIKEDMASMKKLYNQTCRSYVQKDFKIKLLEKNKQNNNNDNTESKLLYEQYEEMFDAQTMVHLRSTNGKKRSDSTFISICMRSLYPNPDRLHLKSAKGTGKNKSEVSPNKKEIMNNLFTERLLNENITEIEFNERYSRFNDLFNTAINNIRRTVSKFSVY